MNSPFYWPLGKAVETAKVFSELDSCTIWALISLCSLAFIWWDRKKHYDNNEAWRGIRERQIASESAQTEVMRRQTEEIVSMKLLITKFLVKE